MRTKKTYSEWICAIGHHSPSCQQKSMDGEAVMEGLLIPK